MALSGHLEETSPRPGKSRAARRALRLETSGKTPQARAAPVAIHNISATGLLLETSASLKPDERIEVDLPHAGTTPARVVWSSGAFHGCQFAEPISAAALSAVQLKGEDAARRDSAPPARDRRETFGARLRRLREAKGLTLARIADQLGVSKPTVWAWEKDRVQPVTGRIEALAGVLGVSPLELLHGGEASRLDAMLNRMREQVATAFGVEARQVRIVIDL